jgi:hypothetical protein
VVETGAGPGSSIGSVTRREIAFLLIGIGLGLLFSLEVVLVIFMSLRGGGAVDNYSIDKLALLIPGVPLVVGIFMLAYRKKSERD